MLSNDDKNIFEVIFEVSYLFFIPCFYLGYSISSRNEFISLLSYNLTK